MKLLPGFLGAVAVCVAVALLTVWPAGLLLAGIFALLVDRRVR